MSAQNLLAVTGGNHTWLLPDLSGAASLISLLVFAVIHMLDGYVSVLLYGQNG